MSSQAVAWAIVHQAGGPSAKAVLMSIANYADAYGECWQDQITLAEGAEIGERQFRTILRGLMDRGLVERVRRGGQGRGRMPDLLRLRMRELPAILTAKRKPETDEQPAISSNRQSLPVAVPDDQQPAKIAERATGNFAGGNRQMVAGTYKDNPTIPTNPPYPPGFEAAWALWPKHVRASSKRIAADRLSKLRIEGPAILAAVSAYLRSPDATKDDRRFVPAFEVWLNKHAEFWIERARPTDAELKRRRDLYAYDGTWRDEWGPKPTKGATT